MKMSAHGQAETSFNGADRHESATPPAAAKTGRDERGRFAAGNQGGPGNPFARRVAQLRQVMLECVTAKEMEIIVGELMVQAKRGNLAAIKLLFQYVLGKPAATVDPDALDLQEVELYRRAPEAQALTDLVTARMPADRACDLLREVLPYVGRIDADLMRETLSRTAEAASDLDDREGADDDWEEDEERAAERDEPEVDSPPRTTPSATGGFSPAARPRASAAPLHDGTSAARPDARTAPSPIGDSGADAGRRRTAPPPNDGNGKAAPRNGRRDNPLPPSEG